jgi:hypothetical protein
MRILLKSFDGERQAGNTPRHVIFEQVTLVCLEEQTLDTFPLQKEKHPVW